MKSLTIAAFLALASVSVAHAECFTTSRAVFQAHPERSTWATWRTIDHRQCWYAKGQAPGWEVPQNTASVLDRPRSRSSITLDTPQVAGVSRTHKHAAVPLPPKRPVTIATRTLAQADTLTETDRADAPVYLKAPQSYISDAFGTSIWDAILPQRLRQEIGPLMGLQ